MLDKGKYRKFGESENSRIVNIMIIVVIIEDLKLVLLLIFRRRILMIIEFLFINNRLINERYILIKNFFL